jgi:hypothetical protein
MDHYPSIEPDVIDVQAWSAPANTFSTTFGSPAPADSMPATPFPGQAMYYTGLPAQTWPVTSPEFSLAPAGLADDAMHSDIDAHDDYFHAEAESAVDPDAIFYEFIDPSKLTKP